MEKAADLSLEAAVREMEDLQNVVIPAQLCKCNMCKGPKRSRISGFEGPKPANVAHSFLSLLYGFLLKTVGLKLQRRFAQDSQYTCALIMRWSKAFLLGEYYAQQVAHLLTLYAHHSSQ